MADLPCTMSAGALGFVILLICLAAVIGWICRGLYDETSERDHARTLQREMHESLVAAEAERDEWRRKFYLLAGRTDG